MMQESEVRSRKSERGSDEIHPQLALMINRFISILTSEF